MITLGIDTSAYTTSLAMVDTQGEWIWESRRVLDVPSGETGLAQSAAFFQHVQNLPRLIAEVPQPLWKRLGGVGISMKPRPVEGSYMPVFTAGFAVAQSIAAARQLPLIETTHQEGHLAAGLTSAKGPQSQRFLAVHLSGGTTELLLVERRGDVGYTIEILGGTTDLHAGQFVDRVGVRLGLPFPSGRHLEVVAQEASPKAASLLPSSVRGMDVSFSGVETAAQRLIDQGIPAADVARAVEGCVARTVAKLILTGIEKTSIREILIVGGVSSNLFIRGELERRLQGKGKCFWAAPEWSRDNAMGVAILAQAAIALA